jgi:Zn-dependent M28 family amino/carboxypeptidase
LAVPFRRRLGAIIQEETVKRVALIALCISLAACAGGRGQAGSAPDFVLSGDSIREWMKVLSSDEYMGRGSGQRGGDMASQYVADRFKEVGLEPVDGSYFQPIPMVGYVTDPSSVSLSFRGKDGAFTATYLDDYVLNAGDPRATSAGGSAEVVFAGYGIDAPEERWNDFAGVDVTGKFILILVNDPPAPADEPELFGGPAMTYYGRWTYKYEEATRQGALGALIVHETTPAGYPWSVVRGGWSGEKFSLPPDPNGAAPAGMMGWLSRDAAVKLLALGRLDFDSLKAAADRRGFVAVPTGIMATAALKASVRDVQTRNVVGLLRGSTRPDEVVTLTSHYDHFGIGRPVNGDSIYNGAYDNASGTAMLVEIAAGFVSLPERPARSVLFISTAGEEQGLLGSQWYCQSPLFPLAKTAGEINMDGANMWGETDDVTIFGEERSGLGEFARQRAAQMDLRIVPDQAPEKGYFFRSDHFPFAKVGVPALYVVHGLSYRGRPAEWGKEIQEDFTAHRYHAPSDEFSNDFVFDGAVQQGLLIARIAWDIAQTPTWPNWNEGQEFKAARDAMMTGK